jgi:hypothetical protein
MVTSSEGSPASAELPQVKRMPLERDIHSLRSDSVGLFDRREIF